MTRRFDPYKEGAGKKLREGLMRWLSHLSLKEKGDDDFSVIVVRMLLLLGQYGHTKGNSIPLIAHHKINRIKELLL